MPTGRAADGGSGSRSRVSRRIQVHFDTWDQFLSARLDLAPAGLFLPGVFDVEVGDNVLVHCTFPGDADGVRLGARVLWRRLKAGSDPSVRAGLGIVLRSSSLTAYRRLVEQAEGKAGLAGRQQERFDLRIPVECIFGRKNRVEVTGEIADVSTKGAAVRVAHRPSVGDAVFLHLEDQLLGAIELSGFVTWVRAGAGMAAARSSIGVELQFPRDDDRKAWERIVGRAKAEARLSTEYSGD